MTIGKYYFTFEYSGIMSLDEKTGATCFSLFSKGTELVANYEESHVTILGCSFIKRKIVDRGANVLKLVR